jgi:endoglucanase
LAILTICLSAACGASDPTGSTISAEHPRDSAKQPRSAEDMPPSGPEAAPPSSPPIETVEPAPISTTPAATQDPPAAVPEPPARAPTPAPAPAPAPARIAAPLPAHGSLRGANLVGMEGGYGFNQANGPIPNSEYPVHSTQVVDYLAGKKVNVLRFLFSWERMQSKLNGPIPAATSGNYKAYFDDYKRIVDYATNVKGMTVIMEPWQADGGGSVAGPSWRGSRVGGGTVTSAHFADFWSKMASVYANNPRVAIGLVNEPNNIDTMVWFGAVQDAVTAIRSTGFTGEIHVPGNGWTAAGNWTDGWYDTNATKRSNAYGWLNARGTGKPLSDPLNKLVVSVHTYADADASGGSTGVVSTSITRSRLEAVTGWARTNGLKVFIGEIGMYANASNAAANWSDFVTYLDANGDTLEGFAWWACGKPSWWDDVAASGGGHFSITPTTNYAGDTVNMTMIKSAFH